MKFPGPEDRPAQYGMCGHILAMTASGIGVPVPDETSDLWAHTMSRLATTDGILEATPEVYDHVPVLMGQLNLDPENPALAAAAEGLIIADRDALSATDLAGHFQARSREAIHAADLLRFQAPDSVRRSEPLWRQLNALAVTGVYLDCFLDARKDAERLTQFTPAQLVAGSLRRLGGAMRSVEPKTWLSLGKASRQTGFDVAVAGKVAETLVPFGRTLPTPAEA